MFSWQGSVFLRGGGHGVIVGHVKAKPGSDDGHMKRDMPNWECTHTKYILLYLLG